MIIYIKKFDELTLDELYEILRLRSEIFVVEQNCAYQDVDSKDKESYHLYIIDKGEILAYLRILPKGVSYKEVSIGRVLTKKSHRKMGLSRRLMNKAIDFIKNTLGEKEIKISAQVYLQNFYISFGFKKTSDIYLEDGIEHIEMLLENKKILHVLAQLPFRTGSGVYFSNLIENFKKYNYEQKAVFGTQDDFKWDILDVNDTEAVEFKTEELPFPIVGMSDVMPYDNTKYSEMTDEMFNKWIRAFRKRLISIKKRYNPDIIFTHHLWILSSLVIEIFPQSKIVGIFHNTDMRQAQMNPKIYNKYVENLHKLDLIFAASENQKDEILSTYKNIKRDKIIAIGGGFNQNIFYHPKKKVFGDKIKLVYSAKIDPSKGIYELIKAYKELNLGDITLDIIGSPDDKNKKLLKEYIKDDESIRVYNVKDQTALGEELRKKDIFLMPSFYEGLGLMAIESLASGLYVVSSEIEALKTLLGRDIEESGIIKYVPLPRIYDVDKPIEADLPKFRENLKEAMLEQIEKVRNKKECLYSQKDNINRFSWESLVDRINEMIF